MQKRLLSLMLALVMCLGLAAPAAAMSAEEGVSVIQVDVEITEVEQKYSIYTESCTAGYTSGIDQTVYNSMKPGTPITVSNVGADPDIIVYVYYYRYDFITTPTEVYDPETSYVIQNVYYGNDYSYALTDRNNHPYYMSFPDQYTESINGLYWMGTDIVDAYTAKTDFKILHSGESVTFTLPDTGGKNVMYQLYANAYYPSLDDGMQNCYFYKWYNIKLEDTAPSASGETPTTAASGAAAFTDVAADAYYAAPVTWALENGITTGATPTTFSPGQNCTNAQILTFLWRAYGEPEPVIANPFTNSIQEAYAKAAVWAYEKGMVSGTAFDADRPCTRAMAVTYMWQAAGSPAAPAASFTDVPAGSSYAPAVAWAVEEGITRGTNPEGTMFSPDEICNRGQIVTFLHRNLA
ncbi:MAG: S-layer homology domain-containing protein [Oscillibacter sp.]|nr:S-layer homology domain-containing protein [Oscillibacter sp.]